MLKESLTLAAQADSRGAYAEAVPSRAVVGEGKIGVVGRVYQQSREHTLLRHDGVHRKAIQ